MFDKGYNFEYYLVYRRGVVRDRSKSEPLRSLQSSSFFSILGSYIA